MVVRGDVDVIVCRSVDRVGRNDKDNSAIRIASKDRNIEWHHKRVKSLNDHDDTPEQ